jgi:hypothetical protein
MVGGTCSTMRAMRMHTEFWSENLEGRDYLEDLGVTGG